MASLFSPYPYCGECSEVEITDEGIKIAETVDIVRLRHLMRESGANPHGRSWFRRANLAEPLSALGIKAIPKICGI